MPGKTMNVIDESVIDRDLSKVRSIRSPATPILRALYKNHFGRQGTWDMPPFDERDER
jgi:hypothetical protein